MAAFQISPPENFNFSTPEEWPRWIRRFERYRQASGLSEKAELSQVNALIYAMGYQAEDILTSFRLSEADGKKYGVVKERFESHFVKRRNKIYEREKFNQRKQLQGEPADDFITSLYCLVEHCGYGELQDEMIRDRIVVGLQDAALSEKLQMEPDLTLESAIAKVRQSELIKKQQPTVRGEERTIESISKRGTNIRKRFNDPSKQATKNLTDRRREPEICSRCGKTPGHSQQHCPAKHATCHKCQRKGHFQKMCRTKKVETVSSEETSDQVFLGAVESAGSSWKVTLFLNDIPIQFKIDTGAEVSVIPESLSEPFSTILKPSTKKLKGPSKQELLVCGHFTCTMRSDKESTKQEVYVVRGLDLALVGLPAIEALNLVAKVCTINMDKEKIVSRFPKLFSGLGCLTEEYHIQLNKDAVPYALTTPRRVPLPLMQPVKKELQRMEREGVITRVEGPTNWCAGMVVVPKPNQKVRICVDLTHLNKSVQRERHILPSVDHTLAQLAEAQFFTKLDANSGFWQVPLSKESARLTTFITPYGRFCFNRLPFGISSAPELFQRRMSLALEGLEGVACLMDDILIHGKTRQEHDQRLRITLERLQKHGITLNKEKCVFATASVKFLGHIVGKEGVRPDPEKVQAIKDLSEPKNQTGLRRFLGMCNQLSKFSSQLTDMTKPLRDLLCNKNQWLWGEVQQKAFEDTKKLLSSIPALSLYDQKRPTRVSADASSFGLGAVLMQQDPSNQWRPVAYASRAMTDTEQRYAQVEKEALAVTWACERFLQYLLGLPFEIETDHKPLVSLLGNKPINELPLRMQRFRMRMMKYTYSIFHVPGKNLVIADALSRAPSQQPTGEDERLNKETDVYVEAIFNSLPASDTKIQQIQTTQDEDSTCVLLKKYTLKGWPSKRNLKGEIRQYIPVANELSICEGLLLRNSRIVVPKTLQNEILQKLHSGHQGINKCKRRALQSVWWPGVNKDIESMVNKCPTCCKMQAHQVEPLIPTSLPTLPWQKVGVDLFEYKNSSYIIVVDYFSRFIETAKLTSTTSSAVITQMKSIFARHGIPCCVMSDNGPQFSAAGFSSFTNAYGFSHHTSSPRYPQANGEVERGVRTVKTLLKKAEENSEDPYLAMLAYRNTPLACGYSPAQLTMCRTLRCTLPMTTEQLKPKLPDMTVFQERERKSKLKMKNNFDSRHRAHVLPPLHAGDMVWLPNEGTEASVLEKSGPRSYSVATPKGTLQRNRSQIRAMPQEGDEQQEDTSAQTTLEANRTENTDSETGLNRESTEVSPVPIDPIVPVKPDMKVVKTFSGRVSKPPKRFGDESS